MKKTTFFLLLCFLSAIPLFASAGLVPCGNPGEKACELGDFFVMLARIYDFIVYKIATPLAIIALTVGGGLWMASAGNPAMLNLGKTMIKSAIIGLVLVFCSFLIIHTLAVSLGYTGNWFTI